MTTKAAIRKDDQGYRIFWCAVAEETSGSNLSEAAERRSGRDQARVLTGSKLIR